MRHRNYNRLPSLPVSGGTHAPDIPQGHLPLRAVQRRAQGGSQRRSPFTGAGSQNLAGQPALEPTEGRGSKHGMHGFVSSLMVVR